MSSLLVVGDVFYSYDYNNGNQQELLQSGKCRVENAKELPTCHCMKRMFNVLGRQCKAGWDKRNTHTRHLFEDRGSRVL